MKTTRNNLLYLAIIENILGHNQMTLQHGRYENLTLLSHMGKIYFTPVEM
jgi:hypothetical protein